MRCEEEPHVKFDRDDVLIVVDMQNDFIPFEDAPSGGKFGVPEGALAAASVISLIEAFRKVKGTIIGGLIRDYLFSIYYLALS